MLSLLVTSYGCSMGVSIIQSMLSLLEISNIKGFTAENNMHRKFRSRRLASG